MKRLHMILIGLIGLLMVMLCVLLGVSLIRGRRLETGHGNYSLVQEKSFPAEDIRSLKIDYGSSAHDVLFYQGTGDEIIVREYMNFEPNKSQLSKVQETGGELTIKGAGKGLFSFWFGFSQGSYTEIYLPAGLAEGMDALSVKTVSGDVLSEIGLTCLGNLMVSTTSGDVRIPEIKADTMQMSSTSGSIRLESVLAERTEISTTSGDITIEQARGQTKISSTSGEILISGLEGPLRTSTTSGDISLGQVTGDITLSTTSGAVRLENGQGDFEAESTSGDIRVENLDGDFKMNTTSGELSVSRGNGSGTAHSVSGDIRIFLEVLAGDLDISTTSGSVGLAFPETADFQFKFSTTSGECETFFEDALSFDSKRKNAEGRYGDGGHSVKISTVSGDLSVREF